MSTEFSRSPVTFLQNVDIFIIYIYIMDFIGLIVRCKDEPYVSEFVNYYIKQGIDKIYI